MKSRGTKTSFKRSTTLGRGSSRKRAPTGPRIFSSKSSAIAVGKKLGRSPAFGTLPHTHNIEDFVATQEAHEDDDPIIEKVITYLGGARVVKKRVRSASDVHDLIVEGMPSETVVHVVARNQNLDQGKIGRALGMSTRTIQRRKDQTAKPLSPEQGGRTWKFSELMVRAASVLGSQDEAERWFDTPAIGLDRRRPIDLMGSTVGTALVEELLGRMEYGVYT